jgi:hypothetical protein
VRVIEYGLAYSHGRGCGGLSRDDGRVEETVEEKRSPDGDVRVCRAAERNTDRLSKRMDRWACVTVPDKPQRSAS